MTTSLFLVCLPPLCARALPVPRVALSDGPSHESRAAGVLAQTHRHSNMVMMPGISEEQKKKDFQMMLACSTHLSTKNMDDQMTRYV